MTFGKLIYSYAILFVYKGSIWKVIIIKWEEYINTSQLALHIIKIIGKFGVWTLIFCFKWEHHTLQFLSFFFLFNISFFQTGEMVQGLRGPFALAEFSLQHPASGSLQLSVTLGLEYLTDTLYDLWGHLHSCAHTPYPHSHIIIHIHIYMHAYIHTRTCIHTHIPTYIHKHPKWTLDLLKLELQAIVLGSELRSFARAVSVFFLWVISPTAFSSSFSLLLYVINPFMLT